MNKTGSAAKVKLNSFDDLFGNNEMQTAGVEQIINAPLAELHDFKNHPFRVVDDEKMEEKRVSASMAYLYRELQDRELVEDMS